MCQSTLKTKFIHYIIHVTCLIDMKSEMRKGYCDFNFVMQVQYSISVSAILYLSITYMNVFENLRVNWWYQLFCLSTGYFIFQKFPIKKNGLAGSLVTLVSWLCSWIVSYVFNFLMSLANMLAFNLDPEGKK